MSRRCYIVGAGEFVGNWVPGDGDYVIAADAGFAHLTEVGIVPDLVVGDFDSLGAPPLHPNVIKSPAEKDDTDLMLAVNEGLKLGIKTFIIDGGLGGRLDQSFSNFQILVNISRRGARGILLGRAMCVTAVTNGDVAFSQGAEGYISVFSAGDSARGVNLTGLKYPLKDAVLAFDYPLGVSNEFFGKRAVISVREGTLIVIWDGGVERLEND